MTLQMKSVSCFITCIWHYMCTRYRFVHGFEGPRGIVPRRSGWVISKWNEEKPWTNLYFVHMKVSKTRYEIKCVKGWHCRWSQYLIHTVHLTSTCVQSIGLFTASKVHEIWCRSEGAWSHRKFFFLYQPLLDKLDGFEQVVAPNYTQWFSIDEFFFFCLRCGPCCKSLMMVFNTFTSL